MSVNNKAILLRSVSTLATAAASTALGVHGAQAQVVPAGTDGYYYSVTGGFALSKSEQFLTGLTDKVGYSNESGSSFTSSATYSSANFWSGYSYTSGSGLDEFKGLFASVSFGKQMGNFDIRGSLSVTTGGHASGGGYSYGGYSSFTFFAGSGGSGSSYSGSSYYNSSGGAGAGGEMSFGYKAADFEVGYTPTLGNNFNVRLFAGLRALQFTSKFEGGAGGSSWFNSGYSDNSSGTGFYSSYYSGYSSYSFSGMVETTFTGIGPRVGVQGSTRFEGTNFGLSGSLATSVLFGKQTVKKTGSQYSYSSYYYEYSGSTTGSGSGSDSGSSFSSANSSYSGNKTVLDLQASVGVDYYLNDNTVLTVGYQGEKLTEIAGDDLGFGSSIDTFSHGAFVKLSGSF